MTSATDELRRLLDERGVEWLDSSDENVLHTTWNTMSCWFSEFPDGWTAWGMAMHGTPEQAIAATLGSGTLTAEQVRDAVILADRWEKPMGNTRLTNTHLIIRDDGWQAIADELNAELRGDAE